MSEHEYFLLYKELAPCASDGAGDAQEWNLFSSYLNVDDNEESLFDRYSLSNLSPMPKDEVKRNSVKRQSRPSNVSPPCQCQIFKAHFWADESDFLSVFLRNEFATSCCSRVQEMFTKHGGRVVLIGQWLLVQVRRKNAYHLRYRQVRGGDSYTPRSLPSLSTCFGRVCNTAKHRRVCYYPPTPKPASRRPITLYSAILLSLFRNSPADSRPWHAPKFRILWERKYLEISW